MSRTNKITEIRYFSSSPLMCFLIVIFHPTLKIHFTIIDWNSKICFVFHTHFSCLGSFIYFIVMNECWLTFFINSIQKNSIGTIQTSFIRIIIVLFHQIINYKRLIERRLKFRLRLNTIFCIRKHKRDLKIFSNSLNNRTKLRFNLESRLRKQSLNVIIPAARIVIFSKLIMRARMTIGLTSGSLQG